MKKLDDVREVFKSIKHKNPAVFYCPKCCSPRIRIASSLSFGLTPKEYYCEKCGYFGPIVMELEEDKNEKEETGT